MGHKRNKRVVPTLTACDEAAALLKSAGFEFVCASMRSEATYYRYPGREGVLRIGTHPSGGGMIGLSHILANITFPPYKYAEKPDHIIINPDKVKTVVAIAIGLYFLNLKDTSKPLYNGPKDQSMISK